MIGRARAWSGALVHLAETLRVSPRRAEERFRTVTITGGPRKASLEVCRPHRPLVRESSSIGPWYIYTCWAGAHT